VASSIDRVKEDRALLTKLRRRVNKARDFPVHTCPASRHVHIMADCLTKKGGYPMLTEEPTHCAITLYSVLASLWEARKELTKLRKKNAVIETKEG
jgi:hypothetical protein